MTKHPFNGFFTVCMSISILYGCTTHGWEPKDMNSRAGRFVEADLKPGSPLCGFFGQCTFELHYFLGRDYADDPKRKNVLYIPGGPGDIVDRANAILDFMRIKANFIYFDVRGTGFSILPESNAYDQFLRAEYVVEDIETLRKKLFKECSDGEAPSENGCKPGPNPWDAIYAHSWGTIVAQRYAAKYPSNVRKLILSAPVSRAHGDTELGRRTKIVDNLIDVYRRQRSNEGCDQKLAAKAIKSVGPDPVPATRTFCFLEENERNAIKNALTTLLNDIGQDYGSTAFVDSFYSSLKADQNFTVNYPYPREFFRALRQLEWWGGGEKEGMLFAKEVFETKINAAFFVGYYLMLKDKPSLTSSDQEEFVCDPNAEFLTGLKNLDLKKNFCKRIERAELILRGERSNDDSPRARAVFGVYDGLARWIFQKLDQERRLDREGCFSGKTVQDVASGNLLKNKPAMREQAKKLGISKFETICPWDPKPYRHDVETLIFIGDADPVIAGGQAEYFFENGLTPGKRVMIEFPGAGHLMSLQVKASAREDVETKIAQEFPSLVDRFLKRAVNQFIEDEDVMISTCLLGAKLFPPKPESKQPQENVLGSGTSNITTDRNITEAQKGKSNC